MRKFGSSSGVTLEQTGKSKKIVGKVEDIITAPQPGEKRLMVREKTGARRTVAVDVPIRHTTEVERKETYRFDAVEKDTSRYGYKGRPSTTGFKAYQSDEKPEVYSGSGGWDAIFDRFGGGDRPGNGGRGLKKFP